MWVVYTIIGCLICSFLGRWVAVEKGYSSTAWFWLCFFLGIFALIAVCGAPDKKSEKDLADIKRHLANAAKAGPPAAAGERANDPPVATGNTPDFWVCKKCGQNNRFSSTCKGCGEYR